MTLTEVSKITKRGLVIFALFVGLYIVLQIFWGGVVAVKNKIFPPPESVPEMAYGNLVEPDLPLTENGEVPAYQLEVGKSQLNDFYKIFPVYKMQNITPSYLAGDNAQKLAEKLGFFEEAEVEKKGRDEFHIWKDEIRGRELKVDLRTWTIQLKTDLRNLHQIMSPGDALYPTEAVSTAKSKMGSLNLLPDDYAAGEPTAQLLKLEGGNLVEAAGAIEAQLTCVHFFRRGMDLGENVYPVYPPKKDAVVKMCLTRKSNREIRILSLNYFYQGIDTENRSTYPLKTFKQAWDEAQELPAGSGVESVTVEQVELAYFENGKPQSFLHPIYLFEGFKTFTDESPQQQFIRFIPAVQSSALTTVN